MTADPFWVSGLKLNRQICRQILIPYIAESAAMRAAARGEMLRLDWRERVAAIGQPMLCDMCAIDALERAMVPE